MSLYVVSEKSYVERGNQISEMARLMRTERKNLLVISLKCAWDLRPERLEDSTIIKNLAENSRCQTCSNTAATGLSILNLEQHRCKRTVYGSFLSQDSRCGATPLLRDCVRVNSIGTGSQHIPDLDQHPYHMGVNSFARCDNPDLKTPLLRDGVRVNSIHFMYYYDISLFLRCLHSVTLDIAFI